MTSLFPARFVSQAASFGSVVPSVHCGPCGVASSATALITESDFSPTMCILGFTLQLAVGDFTPPGRSASSAATREIWEDVHGCRTLRCPDPLPHRSSALASPSIDWHDRQRLRITCGSARGSADSGREVPEAAAFLHQG